jgi:hypothetical protein
MHQLSRPRAPYFRNTPMAHPEVIHTSGNAQVADVFATSQNQNASSRKQLAILPVKAALGQLFSIQPAPRDLPLTEAVPQRPIKVRS